MANLKAGTLIGGNLIWSAGNLPVRTADNRIYINDSQIYSEYYKPSPAAIGAVNKAGDTMTGDLTLSKTNPEIWLHGGSNQAHSGKIYIVEGTNKDHGGWIGYNGADNFMQYGYRANGVNAVVFQHAYNSNHVTFMGNVLTSAAQSTAGNAFVRKDYTDSQIATKVALGGSTMTGKLTLNYTSSVKVPVGTTAQRGSGVSGDFRFNSDEKSYEGFDGTEWQPIGSGRVAYTRYTANFTAVKGRGHLVDTTKAGIVATLPSGLSDSDFVVIGDGSGNASKNPFYIAGYNGDRIVVNSDNCMLLFSWVANKWVITNGIGESGAIDTASYVKRAGDTMLGDLKFAPGKKIVLPTADWATGATIEALPAGDGFGSNLVISSGGNTVLGAGESGNNLRNLTSGEHLYLTADGNIDLISGGNTWADRKLFRIDSAGGLYINNGATVARCHFGSSSTYIARSADNLYVAANGTAGKVYIEGKGNPIARVGSTDYTIYHEGFKPSPASLQAPRVIGEWATGTTSTITTEEFIQLLTDKGAFNDRYWIARGSWSYAANKIIGDTGCGNIHLAGCVIEVISASAGNYTIRITTPTTSTGGGVTNGEFIYVNNGSSYTPGWRRQYNTVFKPSTADIGAVAKAGDSMTGALTITNTAADPKLVIHRTGSNTNICMAFKDQANRVVNFGLGADNHLYYGTAADFTGTGAKIYSTQNKPTHTDLGVISGMTNTTPFRNGANDTWQILARVRMPQSASSSKFAILGGTGFNVGQPAQACECEIVIRSGNNNPKGLTAVLYTKGATSPIVQNVAWKLVSGDDYDIYVQTRAYANVGIRADWTGSGSSLVSWGSDTPSATKPAGVADATVVESLMSTGGSFSGDLISTGRDRGIFGTYDSTKTDQIWSMGTTYRNASDGSNFGNLYGLAYKHTNNASGGTMAGGHQMVWCESGVPRSALGQNVWTSGYVSARVAGNAFHTIGGFIRSNTDRVMSLDGHVYSFVTSPSDAHLCQNAYWDGSTWKKYDVSQKSAYLVVRDGEFRIQASNATSVDPLELLPLRVSFDGNLETLNSITAKGHTIQFHNDHTNQHIWFKNSAGQERGLIYHESTSNSLCLRAASGPRVLINPAGTVILETTQAANGIEVLGQRTGEGAAAIMGATNGGGWDAWRSLSTVIGVSCPNSSSNAHSIWKATQWNRAHLAAMSVHSPSDNSVVVAMSVGVNGYNHFTYNSQGQGFAQGGWHTGSDARFKEQIKPLAAQRTSWLDKVCALNASSFKYKTNENHSIGFIAQDVQSVIPEAISVQIDTTKPEDERAETERLFIDPMAIIAAQNEAIKELVARIEALERK